MSGTTGGGYDSPHCGEDQLEDVDMSFLMFMHKHTWEIMLSWLKCTLLHQVVGVVRPQT